MKKRILYKLRSQTGASISFALLLFLVCAVLCSVIITAATAASGRMSRIAETDQQYYAVTSAAELMKDLIDGKTVKIEKITEGERTEIYSNDSVNSSTKYDNEDDYELKIYSFPKINANVVNSVDVNSLTFDSIVEDAAYKYFVGGGNGELSIKTLDDSGNALSLEAGADSLEVSITETVESNGTIKMIIGDKYKIELIFSASVIEPTKTETAGISTTAVTSETEYTITTSMTKTETTTVTWTLMEINANPEE